MKFYNRTEELAILKEIVNRKKSDFCYFIGRRRIGKTSLVRYFFEKNNIDYLYFFVWNKSEWNLLKNFSETLYDFLWFEVNFSSLREFLKFIFEYWKKNPWLNIVFDEFQNFYYINDEIFSDFQEFWDINKDSSSINIFTIGSIFTLMEKVFRDKSSPLFWRITAKIYLDEFEISVLKQILLDYNIYSTKNLLDVYTLFWWVPKYLEIFDELKNKNDNLLENILSNFYITKNSIFLDEWKDLLIWEFWKSYSTYFSILEAIASWKTKRSEIANYTQINYDSLWIYLEKLEKNYWYIEKFNSIISSKKINRYRIKDNFLIFRFRFIYKRNNLIEIWKYDELIKIINKNITNLQWFIFEKLVKKLIIKKARKNEFIINFEQIWNYFDRTWKNEIDLICFSEETKKVVFIETKLNSKKITKEVKENLEKKANLIPKFNWYKKYFLYYSLDNLEELI